MMHKGLSASNEPLHTENQASRAGWRQIHLWQHYMMNQETKMALVTSEADLLTGVPSIRFGTSL